MDHLEAELALAISAWDERHWPRPDTLVVSGSGLAVDLRPDLQIERVLLEEILPFAVQPIEGHPLSFEILGGEGLPTVAYQRGRVHTYQGYDAAQAVFHVRLAALLGARTLVMTNAAGSLRSEIGPGQLVAISDHLNLIGLNPLRGKVPEGWGPHFPDMTEPYDGDLRSRVIGIAGRAGIELHEGVYAGVAGPSYETPAEIHMLEKMGAHLVGMSTVLEVIAARHMGLRCLAISMVSNHASGIGDGALVHDEVLEVGRISADRIRTILEEFLFPTEAP